MGFTKIIYIVNHKGYLVAVSHQRGISRLLDVVEDCCNMGMKLVSLCVLLAIANVMCDQSPQQEVARASQSFAANVYQRLKNKDGNILVCPVSVQTVLALVQAGAKSETSDQIRSALSLPADKAVVASGYEKLMNSLNSARNVQMDIANIVYVKEGYELSPTFKQTAVKSFKAGIENLNFAQNQQAARTINQWVEQKTHDKIRDLISPNDLSELTRMVLVNALYFKGTWVNKFETYNTRERDFFVTPQQPVKVPMMSTTANFKYAENHELDCKFLEMPYAGNEYAMTIVLPNKRDGLAALESRIEDVLRPPQYRNERVEVVMPLFKVETTIEFNEVLQDMGMRKPFEADADFSGLLQTKEPLYISKVIQKNFINVTEEGTEAASATAVDLQLRSGFPDHEEFHMDQPFFYYIHNINTTTIVFIGRLSSFGKNNEDNDIQTNIIETRIGGVRSNDSGSSGTKLFFNAVTFIVLVIHFIY